jgi:hypothetical protein
MLTTFHATLRKGENKGAWKAIGKEAGDTVEVRLDERLNP